jgi:hypothetical protein
LNLVETGEASSRSETTLDWLRSRFRNHRVNDKNVLKVGAPLGKLLDGIEDSVDSFAQSLHESNKNHNNSEKLRTGDEAGRRLEEERLRIDREHNNFEYPCKSHQMPHNTAKPVCPKCGGLKKCGVCEGTGRVEWGTRASGMPLITNGAPGSSEYVRCPHCHGRGICPSF